MTMGGKVPTTVAPYSALSPFTNVPGSTPNPSAILTMF
jgi:hypothetical protein